MRRFNSKLFFLEGGVVGGGPKIKDSTYKIIYIILQRARVPRMDTKRLILS